MIESQKLTVRPYDPADYSVMADIANAANHAVGDGGSVTAEELAVYFSAPDFDRLNDSFLLERDGRMVGMTDLEFSAASGHAQADGVVHPEHNREGIGTELIRLTEARALARAEAELTADQSLSLQRNISATNAAAIRLFEAHGYRLIRTFYQMRIVLDQPIEVPPLPAGLELRPFDRARHAEAVYEAQQESFADHWGFERHSFEDWAHYMIDSPSSDVSMWLIARDEASDEIAGICLNRPYEEADQRMGWTGSLGVRRPWRKQGLGLALLTHSFALFQERGYVRAGLGVDASSLTNAVELYKHAGMHIHAIYLFYRKMLRGQFED